MIGLGTSPASSRCGAGADDRRATPGCGLSCFLLASADLWEFRPRRCCNRDAAVTAGRVSAINIMSYGARPLVLRWRHRRRAYGAEHAYILAAIIFGAQAL